MGSVIVAVAAESRMDNRPFAAVQLGNNRPLGFRRRGIIRHSGIIRIGFPLYLFDIQMQILPTGRAGHIKLHFRNVGQLCFIQTGKRDHHLAFRSRHHTRQRRIDVCLRDGHSSAAAADQLNRNMFPVIRPSPIVLHQQGECQHISVRNIHRAERSGRLHRRTADNNMALHITVFHRIEMPVKVGRMITGVGAHPRMHNRPFAAVQLGNNRRACLRLTRDLRIRRIVFARNREHPKMQIFVAHRLIHLEADFPHAGELLLVQTGKADRHAAFFSRHDFSQRRMDILLRNKNLSRVGVQLNCDMLFVIRPGAVVLSP